MSTAWEIEGAGASWSVSYPEPPVCDPMRRNSFGCSNSRGVPAGSEVVFAISDIATGACETFGGGVTVEGAVKDAASAASLSAASAAALSVLRSDDEVLLLRVWNAADVRARKRAKRPLSRSTDSGSDSADCSCPGNRK
jgi:hypothetical protein